MELVKLGLKSPHSCDFKNLNFIIHLYHILAGTMFWVMREFLFALNFSLIVYLTHLVLIHMCVCDVKFLA